jgi:transposase-like protein
MRLDILAIRDNHPEAAMHTAAPIHRYKHHRFPAEIISHGVWLYFRFCLSYRDVEELLFARGIIVTYEAIRQWCRKFGQAYANQLRHRRPRPGEKWHLEMCQTQPIKISWCPLRLCEQALRDLRGGFKRENKTRLWPF